MAKELDDAEFWLPSEFLCDEIFLGGGNRGREGKAGLGGAYFSGELPLGTDANLDDSPVESVTETEESDEEDYLAGLTQQMARYFLQDDEKDASAAAAAEAANNAKTMAGSPQSTLCAWSSASNKGSPNGPSLVSSPPSSSPLQQQRITDHCDLLREAAGQVMRLRTTNDLGRHQGLNDIGLLSVPNKPTPVVTSVSKNAAAGYYAPNHITTQQQLQAAHFYYLRQQQAIKQQLSTAWGRQSKGRVASGGGYGEGRCGRTLDLSHSAWPPLRKPPPQPSQQPQSPSLPGSGMRAVFLHTTGSRKESAGTGVFLPRTAGSKLEPKKKTGCSTVLVPDRVVQALNLNLEELAAQPRFPGGFVLSHDALMGRSGAVLGHQKKSHQHVSPAVSAAAGAAVAAHEIGLPQEWIY
ncbi:hypothetical protein OPV22_031203 [Ensete ventricosum]|uniref:Ataxin-2 C-terminal domain-containing protein n=1 Tax=Ensete ventricosum TaxID=4639 RepID=A0AAV8PSY6_ENSVE|nr:hypothetical protein OPV22_031203 [Ensete ventricosum]